MDSHPERGCAEGGREGCGGGGCGPAVPGLAASVGGPRQVGGPAPVGDRLCGGRGDETEAGGSATPPGGAVRSLQVSFTGLELFGHHGVLDEEQRMGQRFVVDVAVAPLESALGDELSRTVSYVALMETAEDVVAGRSFQLIESVAEALAEEILCRYPVGRVWVRVGKPHAPLRFSVQGVFAEFELRRPGY